MRNSFKIMILASGIALAAVTVNPADVYAQDSNKRSFFGIFGGKSSDESSSGGARPVFVDNGASAKDSPTSGIYDNRRDNSEKIERVTPVDPVAAAEARSRNGQLAAASVLQDLADKKAAQEGQTTRNGPTKASAGGEGGKRVIYKKPGESDKKPIRLFNVP